MSEFGRWRFPQVLTTAEYKTVPKRISQTKYLSSNMATQQHHQNGDPSDSPQHHDKGVATFANDEALANYLHTVTNKEPAVCQWIRETTAKELGDEIVMVPSIDQGKFLTTLANITNAKLVVEVGVFTGYSSTSFALGMPAGGRLIGLDVSEEWTKYAREAWKRAGVDDKCELRLGPAKQTLEKMLREEAETFAGKVDLMFVDADKQSMPEYYEFAIKMLRPGGVVVMDNTLWFGKLWDKSDQDERTIAIRKVNERIANDNRVFAAQLPFSDGITVVTKKRT